MLGGKGTEERGKKQIRGEDIGHVVLNKDGGEARIFGLVETVRNQLRES